MFMSKYICPFSLSNKFETKTPIKVLFPELSSPNNPILIFNLSLKISSSFLIYNSAMKPH